MRFFPENYKEPTASDNYMKMVEGENRLRILSESIMGWEEWLDKKVFRYKYNEKPSKSQDPSKPIKMFIAFVVWNYKEEKIQILNITQVTIRKQIESLCNDSEWGSPYFYDIKIIRQGDGKETEYMINPLPHRPTSQVIRDEYKAKPCHLEALFDNADPFAIDMAIGITQGIFERADVIEAPKVEIVTEAQGFELVELYKQCDPKYQAQLKNSMAKPEMGNSDLMKLPTHLYERIKTALTKNADEYQKTKTDDLPF